MANTIEVAVYDLACAIGERHRRTAKVAHVLAFSAAWDEICDRLGITEQEQPRVHRTALNGYSDGLDN